VKKSAALIVLLLGFLFSYNDVLAVVDPLSVPNNKTGIHIFSEKDLESAAALVNSSGGDWGYVTFVITESERDRDRWQKVFDQMRRLHLVPIVRIATKADGAVWQKPKDEEINNWVGFLNSLNWVVQNRYVIIGNEPNHSAEWGGILDPAGYAKYLKLFSMKLREASGDFFILPAALDASAANLKDSMDEGRYLRKMLETDPLIFDSIDGWNSHSYPNPHFSGKETDIGRGTIRTFDWELTYLKTLNVQRNLPVFITETGWSNKAFSEDQIGSKFVYAFEHVWDDPRIVAVTSFILSYPNPPFDFLSWQKSDGSFYSFFGKVAGISKQAGDPERLESGQIVAAFAQPLILHGSDFVGAILAKNTGQSIWGPSANSVKGENAAVRFTNYLFLDIEPGKLGLILFKSKAPESEGLFTQAVYLSGKKGQRITNNFPIEAYVTRVDLSQIQDFFARILGSVR